MASILETVAGLLDERLTAESVQHLRRVLGGDLVLELRAGRPGGGTLDGEEINRLHESVIEMIRQETGGRLREG